MWAPNWAHTRGVLEKKKKKKKLTPISLEARHFGPMAPKAHSLMSNKVETCAP
jgi:hypothetical protein